jgi:hypothetical protein
MVLFGLHGEMEVHLYALFTLALYICEWSALPFCSFNLNGNGLLPVE